MHYNVLHNALIWQHLFYNKHYNQENFKKLCQLQHILNDCKRESILYHISCRYTDS